MKGVAMCAARNSPRKLVGTVLAMTGSVVARTASAREDWQYWSTWSASHKLSEKATVSALAEVYFRDDMQDDYVYDEYLIYSHQLAHGFGGVAQAYFESVEAGEGGWTGLRSLVAGPTYTVEIPKLGRLKLEDRFFFRLTSPAKFDYHRPRGYLTRDIGPLTLVLSDELRVDLSGDRPRDFYRNRFYATVLWKATPKLTLGGGYLRQSDHAADGDWSSINGLQTVVNVAF